MFWTQNLKPLTIRFALGIVHITEESGCSVEKKKNVSKATEVGKVAVHFEKISFSYPSILVGYMEPKEV